MATPLPKAPTTLGHPGLGFTTARAQQWILAAALITGAMYAFRRIIEPSLNSAPSKGSGASRIAGAGSPPPSLAHWSIAYGAGFMMLSVVSIGAPEFAAALAMLMVAGSLLTNGQSVVADLNGLQGTTVATSPVGPSNVPTPAGTPKGAGGEAGGAAAP